MSNRTVFFEETGEEREVVHRCLVCRVSEEDVLANEFILSPSGVAHRTNGFEDTACGHDATGDGWWWPL